ncbi:LptA/OstA family protein [Nisaea sp.]|uniref:LptA/OstA family protein n=1 Tax=Nisaea sp. TaxID=2024842 RepID=UPI003264D2C8
MHTQFFHRYCDRHFGVVFGAMSLLAVLLCGSGDAYGQSLQSADGEDAPVTVEADDGIEWIREDQMYVARGNARAERGGVTVAADTLTALYRDKSGATDIYRLEAIGNVVISSEAQTGYGERAVYDLDEAVAVMLGTTAPPRLETGTETITARDSLEYWDKRQIAVARGNAEAKKDDRTIRADTLIARFEEDAAGTLVAKRMDAVGNVVITTAEEVARGDEGIYNVDSETAILQGNVRITRGDNQLNGERAEVNLKTGISKLLAGSKGDRQRVRGLFNPKSGNK